MILPEGPSGYAARRSPNVASAGCHSRCRAAARSDIARIFASLPGSASVGATAGDTGGKTPRRPYLLVDG